VRAGCGQGLVAYHYLNESGGITKIKKGDSTMIATASYPAGQSHSSAGILGTKGADAMGAHHGCCPFRSLERHSILRASSHLSLPHFLYSAEVQPRLGK
jgi:hypothetical protein